MTSKTFKYGTGQEAKLDFGMLRPSESLKVLLYLSKIVGGALGDAISAFSLGDTASLDKIGAGDLNLSKLGEVIPVMLGRIDEEETLKKIDIVLSSVKHAGNKLDADYFIFDGRPDLILKILKEALDKNYRFFFQENSHILEKINKSREAILNSMRPSEKQT